MVRLSFSILALGFLPIFVLGQQTPASAATKIVSLSVAAAPSLQVTNAEVDKIIAGMNALMKGSHYSWDASCDVQFVRHDDVVANPGLLLSGTYEEIAGKAKSVTPNANIVVALDLNCGGISGAAGCTTVGQTPSVVILYPGFDAELWLHEVGHSVGLHHSAEWPATDKDVPQDIGLRFMFWQLGIGHVGKLPSECTQFRNGGAMEIMAAAKAAPVAAGPAKPPSSLADQQVQSDNERQTERMAKEAGLTISAFRAVGPPWADAIPVEEIQHLNAADLASIRAMLSASPNPYWPQAAIALSLVGSQNDTALLQHLLELPLPAIGPNAPPQNIAQMRNLLRIKLSSQSALGILANRTHAPAAVSILKASSTLDRAQELAGPAAASALSKNALQALAVANTAEARAYLAPVIKGSSTTAGHQIYGAAVLQEVAPLSPGERRSLSATLNKAQTQGIESLTAPEPATQHQNGP